MRDGFRDLLKYAHETVATAGELLRFKMMPYRGPNGQAASGDAAHLQRGKDSKEARVSRAIDRRQQLLLERAAGASAPNARGQRPTF